METHTGDLVRPGLEVAALSSVFQWPGLSMATPNRKET